MFRQKTKLLGSPSQLHQNAREGVRCTCISISWRPSEDWPHCRSTLPTSASSTASFSAASPLRPNAGNPCLMSFRPRPACSAWLSASVPRRCRLSRPAPSCWSSSSMRDLHAGQKAHLGSCATPCNSSLPMNEVSTMMQGKHLLVGAQAQGLPDCLGRPELLSLVPLPYWYIPRHAAYIVVRDLSAPPLPQ